MFLVSLRGASRPSLEEIVESSAVGRFARLRGDHCVHELQGPNVFMGYYKDEAATRAALQDGWLRSGDLGAFDDGNFLKLIGRKKEIIITAGGKNVSPKNIEAALKSHPMVHEAVVIGDRRKKDGPESAYRNWARVVRGRRAAADPRTRNRQAAGGRQALGEGACALVENRIRDRLKQLSSRLADADWLDGTFSAGDRMMVSVLLRLRASGILDEYPNLAAYVARGEARPAYQRAFDAQSTVYAGKPATG